nr:unnamed protein product [Digitaria exilis]
MDSATLARTAAPRPSPAITSLTTAAIFSLPFDSDTLIAAPTPSDSITAFCRCSAKSGHATIGTPYTRLSSTEFHPQCVRNPPVAGWDSTFICGAHDGTTRPTSLVLSTNPSGRNLCPLISSPSASSLICSVGNDPPEPKETKITDFAGCRSSHSMHGQPLPAPPPSRSAWMSGPTGYTTGRSGDGCRRIFAGPGSTASKELTRMASASRVGLILERHEDVRTRDRHASGETNRLREVTELAGDGDVELREVEDEREHVEVRREEEVLPANSGGRGGVEGVGAEEVGDEGDEVGGA